MNRSPEDIRAEMDETRSALTGKLDLLEHQVTSKIDRVKRTFDIPYQVRQHPWPMVGASVALGALLATVTAGRDLLPDGSPAIPTRDGYIDVSGASPARRGFREVFGDELKYLQRVAVGAAVSYFRNSLDRRFPGMGSHADRVISSLSKKFGNDHLEAPNGYRAPDMQRAAQNVAD